MIVSRLRTRVLGAAALVSLVLSACSGSSGTLPNGGAAAGVHMQTAPQTHMQNASSARALYVSDTYGKSVFRFARNSDGTLATPAGSSLVLGYHPGPIAIGPNGALFVTDQENESVEVYPRLAKGYQQPSRTLLVPFAPSCVAVDAGGYEYVGGYTNGFVAVYAPRAHGPANTIGRIALPDGHLTINGVAVDSSGNLYVSDSNEVSEFATPTTHPALLRAIIGSGEQNQPTGMSVDNASGELYVANAGDANILAYAPTANGKSKPDRTVESKNPPLVTPLGVAVRGRALYSTSGSHLYGTPSVFVFDALRGRQTPKQVVTDPYLASPVGVALGP